MNSLKEIYLDLERLSVIKAEEIYFTKSVEFTTRTTIDTPMKSKARGITMSLSNFLIFGIIEENTLNLTITKTTNRVTRTTTDTQTPMLISPAQSVKSFIKKYTIVFTDFILDNITANMLSEEKFLLTVFTIDGQIKQIEFDNLTSYQVFSGSFNKNMNIIYIEYLNYFGSNFFALGTTLGTIYIIKLTQYSKGILNYEIYDEIKRLPGNFTEKISSYIPYNLNIFSSSRNAPDAINSIKYIGNNLLAYVTEQLVFKIYNFNKKKEVYSNCLIKNRSEELLISSKINFMSLSLNEDDVKETRSKCFIFTIYIEYNLIHAVQSFEIWFMNIPELYCQYNNHMSEGLNDKVSNCVDFQSFYDAIELGFEVKIKNTRVYKLNGKVVDMVNYDKRVWVVSENPGYSSQSTSENENDLEKYDLKIFSINNLENNKFQSMSMLTPEQSLIFIDSKFKNVENIINQIKSYKTLHSNNQIENDLLFLILTNEDLIPSDILISVFNKILNQQFGQKTFYNNKTQIINFLEKNASNIDMSVFLNNTLESIIKEQFDCNEILSLGSFSTVDIEGLAFVRRCGISLIKKMTDFQNINNLINKHEYFFRNLIFDSKNINKYQTHNNLFLYELQSKINNYITLESKQSQENITFILFALMRVYLTESNLYLNDEKYLFKIFNNENLENFIKFNFTDNLTNQFNNLTYLDVFHQIIYNVYLNYKSFIEEHITLIVQKYELYKTDRRDRTLELAKVKQSERQTSRMGMKVKSEKFNSKFVELLSKLIHDKIRSFYNISRDILSLKCWTQEYLKTETSITLKFNDKIDKMFVECYSAFLLSNHRCKVNPKESSVIEHVCLVDRGDIVNLGSNNVSNLALQNDPEISYVELTIYENLYNFGAKIFQEIHNEYIDYIILTIWPDITEVVNDTNRARRYDQIEKLFKMKEYKMLSLLIKLQNVNNLENIFIDILCQALINDEESNTLMKDLVNKYFSLILDNSNKTGKLEFKMFEEFYKIFSAKEIFNKNPEFGNLNVVYNLSRDENLLIITGYYYLEEQLKNIINEDMKYEFYFNCYTFIYPTLIDLDSILFKGGEEISNEEISRKVHYQKIEEFLINMLKSCIDIDIDLALSFYSTIRENFKRLNSISQVIEMFVDYLIKSIQNNNNGNFIAKLPSSGNDLIEKICSNLQQKCENMKDNTQMINLLKASLNLEIDYNILTKENVGNPYLKDFDSNYFLILCNIYLILKDYENAARICYSYSESIKSVIQFNHFSLSDLQKVFIERKKALSLIIQSFDHIERISTSTDFITYDIGRKDHLVKFISRDELLKDKILIGLRIELLNNLNNPPSNKFKIEDINKIKNDAQMLNLIFQLGLFDIILDYELIAKNILSETTTKKLIINFIRAHILGGSLKANYSNLLKFYDQIIESGNQNYLLTTIECLLFLKPHMELPENLILVAQEKIAERLAEVLLKYSRFNELIGIIVYMTSNDRYLPQYFVDMTLDADGIDARNKQVLLSILS